MISVLDLKCQAIIAYKQLGKVWYRAEVPDVAVNLKAAAGARSKCQGQTAAAR